MTDIILYPTDTLYGLGVDATNPEAVGALRALKGRDEKKAISIVVADLAMAEEYAIVTPLAKKLAAQFLPGKLSIVLTATDMLPIELTAGTGTVAIRIPDHPVPLQLVKELGKPITATSANIADMPTEASVEAILKQFWRQRITHHPRYRRGSIVRRALDPGRRPRRYADYPPRRRDCKRRD